MAFPDDFVRTVIRVGAEVSQTHLGARSLANRFYRDADFEKPASEGDRITFVIPSALTVSNDVSTVGSYQTPDSTKVTVTMSTMPAVNFKIDDWSQVKSNPTKLREIYVEPAFVAIATWINSQIGALITAANFNTYTPIAHATADVVTPTQFRKAKSTLRNANVPVDSPERMSLFMGSEVYENTMAQAEFSKADTRGNQAAESYYTSGTVSTTLGATFVPDVGMPKPTISSQLTHVSFYADKTAIGIAFRPLEIPEELTGVIMNFNGIPIRMMTGYDMLTKSRLLSFDLAAGFGAARKAHGILIYSNASA